VSETYVATRQSEGLREWFENGGREALGCLPGCRFFPDDSFIGFGTEHEDACPRAATLAEMRGNTLPSARSAIQMDPTPTPALLPQPQLRGARPYRRLEPKRPGTYRGKHDVRATARYLKAEVEYAGVMDGTEPPPRTHRAVMLGMFDKVIESGLNEIAFSIAEAAERGHNVPGSEDLTYWSARKALGSLSRQDYFQGPVRPRLSVNQELARRQRAARGGRGQTANFYRMRGIRDSRSWGRAVFAAYPPFR
jgi:hypothetical protein